MQTGRYSLTRREFMAATAASMVPTMIGFGASDNTDVASRIAAAIPKEAPARPQKPRKLLIFDLNVGYGGHGSIPTANMAFTMMGQKTGAFETVVTKDPAVFAPESLKTFDAVFFNNTVGNLFTDPELRRSLVEFVYSGGGLMGVHGTTVAFTKWPGAIEDWPEFAVMLGARGANHRENTEHVFVKLDDPGHPVLASFAGKGFEYRDEFFRYQEVYSRDRDRVLLSIDTDKTNLDAGQQFGATVRQDNDYALAWVRGYGRGRVFHCTIAHNPYVFWDPEMLKFYLAGAQFALGDLAGPTTPSAKLTRSVKAQEKLGWRVGMAPAGTLFETIDTASQAGLLYVTAKLGMPVGGNISAEFGPDLEDNVREQIRLKLDAAAVRLLICSVDSMPDDESAYLRLFEFARKMGIEAMIADVTPEKLNALGKLCDAYDIRLALRTAMDNPKKAMETVVNRSRRIGLYGDLGRWVQAGINPANAVSTIGDRLVVCAGGEYDVDEQTAQEVLGRIRTLGLKPTILAIEPSAGLYEVIEALNWILINM